MDAPWAGVAIHGESSPAIIKVAFAICSTGLHFARLLLDRRTFN
jgi:hypothetical protein